MYFSPKGWDRFHQLCMADREKSFSTYKSALWLDAIKKKKKNLGSKCFKAFSLSYGSSLWRTKLRYSIFILFIYLFSQNTASFIHHTALETGRLTLTHCPLGLLLPVLSQWASAHPASFSSQLLYSSPLLPGFSGNGSTRYYRPPAEKHTAEQWLSLMTRDEPARAEPSRPWPSHRKHNPDRGGCCKGPEKCMVLFVFWLGKYFVWDSGQGCSIRNSGTSLGAGSLGNLEHVEAHCLVWTPLLLLLSHFSRVRLCATP